MSSVIRRSGLAVLYVLYLLAILLVVHYVAFWRPFVRTLRNTAKPPNPEVATVPYVDTGVMQHLGTVQTDKRSSFVNFAPEKPDGVLRVCAFGDSFTHGDEVDESHDYPTLLQELFDRRCHGRVEVLNFGSGWHGFHQTYLMWERVGRRFSCDYVLLGPRTFYPERDTTFNHTQFLAPYFLHSRYVLDGDDVRLVAVLGETYTQRFDHYFRFFPHWMYLRYDRNAPPVLQAALPQGTTLPNPFYYFSGSAAAEAFLTYRVLLRKLAAQGSRVLLLHDDETLRDLTNGLDMPNLLAEPIVRFYGLPYRAPRDHNSAWGNQIVAEQFYAHLVGGGPHRFTVLRSVEAPFPAVAAAAADRPPLRNYDTIEVELSGLRAAVFTPTKRVQKPEDAVPSSLRGSAVVSLLALKSPGQPLSEAIFVPMRVDVPVNAEVALEVRGWLSTRRYILGRTQLISPRVNIGVVTIDGFSLSRQWQFLFQGNADLTLVQVRETGGRLSVRVGDQPILDARVTDDGVILTPRDGELWRLRTGLFAVADVGTLPQQGQFDLVLRHPQRGTERLPLATWTQQTIDVPPGTRRFSEQLAVTAGCE